MLNRLVVKNYRVIRDMTLELNDHLNIIVANNECGKSTIIEAIHLCLTGQLNGRNIQSELHPFLLNQSSVKEYISSLLSSKPSEPPKVIIEAYFKDDNSLTRFKGSINSLKLNCPGVSLTIEFDEAFNQEYAEFVRNPSVIRNVPIEYYVVRWRTFANENITARSCLIKSTLIDPSAIRHNVGANRYIVDMMKDFLSVEERVQVSLAYRRMKDTFLSDENVKKVNDKLNNERGDVSNRKISVSLDSSSRGNWESGIETQVDDIPLSLAGKGEQNCIKLKLAMNSADSAQIFLIEEPENHLSHSNLNQLIRQISEKSVGKQLIVTTHSSFVLNKLGIENVILLNKDQKSITLTDLDFETQRYFMKLPGHESLRLILAKKAILVEGPSDELLVQKAFFIKYGCMPLEKGVDVISVHSLAFKRFLQISKLLSIPTIVVTDNDGDVNSIIEKYKDFKDVPTIKICYDLDTSAPTLEDHLLKSNGLSKLNEVLGKSYASDTDILKWMKSNKTDCALKIFSTTVDFSFPNYINESIKE